MLGYYVMRDQPRDSAMDLLCSKNCAFHGLNLKHCKKNETTLFMDNNSVFFIRFSADGI